jgi:FG-GAP repeat
MSKLKLVLSPLLIAAGLLFASVTVAHTQSERSARDPERAAKVSIAPVELTASDGVAGTTLGTSVAASGRTIVVGENCGEIGGNTNCNPNHQGVVYVYKEPKGGWENMAQTAELTPSDGYVGDGFGTSVAISGSTIVVGALNGLNGKVYVFVEPRGGWKNMTETAQLTDGVSGDYFGGAVAIDENTIVAGAPTATIGGNQSQGAAYVFVEPLTGWVTTSAFSAQLTASDGSFRDGFGFSTAVSGETIVVGGPDHQGQTGPGEAYVFVKPPAGWASTTQTAKLTRSNPGPYDEFGSAVAIEANTILVGAPQAVGTNNGQGVVDIFVKPSKGWGNTTEKAELVSPFFVDLFGFSIAIEGRDVVVGTFSTSNTIFVYAKPTKGGWKSTSQPESELTAGNSISLFGFSVAITDSSILAGAPFQTVDGQEDQGAAFVFSQ